MVGSVILRVLTLKFPCGVVFKERWSDKVQCYFITLLPIIFSFCPLWGKKCNQSVVHCIWMATWSHYMHHFVSRTVILSQWLSTGGFMQHSILKPMMVSWISKQNISLKALNKFQLQFSELISFFFSFILKKNANIEGRCQSLIEV